MFPRKNSDKIPTQEATLEPAPEPPVSHTPKSNGYSLKMYDFFN